MNLRYLSLSWMAAALAVAAPSVQAQVPSKTWDGGAGTANWSDAANWEPDGVPGATDIVFITSAQADDPTSIDVDIDALGITSIIFTGTVASGDLVMDGNGFDFKILQSRHTRALCSWTTGNPQITCEEGTDGLEVGMRINNGSGIPFPAPTITSIDSPTTFTIDAVPTADATEVTRDFDATSNLVLEQNFVIDTASGAPIVAGNGAEIRLEGDLSGPGGINGPIRGNLVLAGTNSYLGQSRINNGQITFVGDQAIPPFVPGTDPPQLEVNFGRFEFASTDPKFSYLLPDDFKLGGGPTFLVGEGDGQVYMTGSITGGDDGPVFSESGTGRGIFWLAGTNDWEGKFSTNNETLVRLVNPLTPWAGNEESVLDGTLDLMSNDLDRQVRFNNTDGLDGLGNLTNSALDDPSTLSGDFTNLGTNTPGREFGGPGTLIVTGDITVQSGSPDGRGLNRAGPGATLIRSTNFTDSGNTSPQQLHNGTLVLDNTTTTSTKMPAGGVLQIQNGRLVLLGNNAVQTDITVTDIEFDGVGNTGFGEIDIRAGSGAGASLTFGDLIGLSDVEGLNFQVDQGSGAAAINTSIAAGKLPTSITLNRGSFVGSDGSVLGASSPDVLAANEAELRDATDPDNDDVDVVGSFAVTDIDEPIGLRSLRFSDPGGHSMTVDETLNMDPVAFGAPTGIIVAPGTGEVGISSSDLVGAPGVIALGGNSALYVHQHGADTLTIDNTIDGGPGTELVKTGAGELALTSALNDYNSGTFLYAGTLTVSKMADRNEVSSIGQGTEIVMGARNAVDLSTGMASQQPAVLQYLGAGDTTDRDITLVGVSEITNNGSGALDFTGDVESSIESGNWNDFILSGSGGGSFSGELDLGHGRLVKRGTGTWAADGDLETYGTVLVDQGILELNGAVSPFASVSVTAGARLRLGFSGASDIAMLTLDGVPQPLGTYGAPGSGALNESDAFAGGGVLNVLFGTEPTLSPFELWAVNNGLDGTPGKEAGFADNPDGDPFANGLEWILGGSPLSFDRFDSLVSFLGGGQGGIDGIVFAFTRNAASLGNTEFAVSYSSDLFADDVNTVTIGSESSVGPGGVEITVLENAPAPDDIFVTIPPSNAVDGRIFSRLEATEQ